MASALVCSGSPVRGLTLRRALSMNDLRVWGGTTSGGEARLMGCVVSDQDNSIADGSLCRHAGLIKAGRGGATNGPRGDRSWMLIQQVEQ
jgi:hypothetical protein